MNRIFAWTAANEQGDELLNRFIRPLAGRLGATVETPGPGDDRRRLVRAIRECGLVICDGSVEPGHIYHKYVELTKVRNHVALCSRTALPRNVYAFHQFAPRHAEAASNAEIGAWLERVAPGIIAGGSSRLGYWRGMMASLNEQVTRTTENTGLFTSYRGRLYEQARAKAAEVGARLKVPVRVVPPGEFVYETECMTRQMTWATVSGLEREVHRAQGVLIVNSHDYFDSFWTTTEMFVTLAFRRASDGTIRGGLLIDEDELGTASEVPARSFDLPAPTREDFDTYKRLLRQGDPGVVAPELRRGNSGVPGLVFGLIAKLTGHARSPGGPWWWEELMVPCPRCRPRGRRAAEVRWASHLALEGYGFFPVPLHTIADTGSAVVLCPACGGDVHLVNRKPARTLWVPGPSGRPWHDEMEVVVQEPLWETLDQPVPGNGDRHP